MIKRKLASSEPLSQDEERLLASKHEYEWWELKELLGCTLQDSLLSEAQLN